MDTQPAPTARRGTRIRKADSTKRIGRCILYNARSSALRRHSRSKAFASALFLVSKTGVTLIGTPTRRCLSVFKESSEATFRTFPWFLRQQSQVQNRLLFRVLNGDVRASSELFPVFLIPVPFSYRVCFCT